MPTIPFRSQQIVSTPDGEERTIAPCGGCGALLPDPHQGFQRCSKCDAVVCCSKCLQSHGVVEHHEWVTVGDSTPIHGMG